MKLLIKNGHVIRWTLEGRAQSRSQVEHLKSHHVLIEDHRSSRSSAGALSAFGRKSVRHAMESPSHCSRSQEAGVGAEKVLAGTVRKDKMLANETE